MNTIRKLLWTAFAAVLLPINQLSAHPGHGNPQVDGNAVEHYLTELGHILSFGVIILLFFAVRIYYLKNIKKEK